ncbi:MAG: dihydrolipoyl dehydrogenase [Bacteroidales bacterium]|nr:dihydrolipoyl dehydrogenase [Bacteroidales bacterium]
MKIVIIGAGPGGYETALLAAKRGVEVVLIEAGHVGGTCLNEGCIPTKSFCKNAEVIDSLREAETFGITGLSYDFDFKAVTARKNAVVEQLRGGVEGLLGHKLITLVRGKASFKDAHTVVVTRTSTTVIPSEAEGRVEESTEYTADYIIIATGSVSASLPIPGADLPGILTSKEILDLEDVPKRLCVIGGGVIGLEFASVFRSFGSEVTVLEYFKDILPRFDSDLSKRLKQSLGKRGIEICTQAQVTGITTVIPSEAEGSSVIPSEAEGRVEESPCYRVTYIRKGKEETVEADKVLMAVGRKANVGSLNLADAGIEFTPRGIVANDRTMQTNVPHIYAIGDVNGKMMLAHAATFQGIVALDHIMGIENEIDLSVMPAAVFTSPEAASVGMTEDECKEAGIPVKCLKSFFRANGKAVTMGETDGFCKLIVAAEPKEGCVSPFAPGRILGCHLYGPHASDIVQEACALISRNATLKQFESIIHTHPTLTEVLQSAVHG